MLTRRPLRLPLPPPVIAAKIAIANYVNFRFDGSKEVVYSSLRIFPYEGNAVVSTVLVNSAIIEVNLCDSRAVLLKN